MTEKTEDKKKEKRIKGKHLVVDNVAIARYVDATNPDMQTSQPRLNSSALRVLRGSLEKEKADFITLVPENHPEFLCLLTEEFENYPEHKLIAIPAPFDPLYITNYMSMRKRVDRGRSRKDADISFHRFSTDVVDFLDEVYESIVLTGYAGKNLRDIIISMKLIGPLFYYADGDEKYSELENITKFASVVMMKNDDLKKYEPFKLNNMHRMPRVVINVREHGNKYEIQFVHSDDNEVDEDLSFDGMQTDLSVLRLSIFNTLHRHMKNPHLFSSDHLKDVLLEDAVEKAILTSISDPSSNPSELFSIHCGELNDLSLASERQNYLCPSGVIKKGDYVIRAYLNSKRALGGDIYVAEDVEGKLRLALADITGKGTLAAMDATTLYSNVRDNLKLGKSIKEVSISVEDYFSPSDGAVSAFANFVDIVQENDRINLEYLNCGASFYVFTKKNIDNNTSYSVTCYNSQISPLGYNFVGLNSKSSSLGSLELNLDDSEHYVLMMSDGFIEAYNLMTEQLGFTEQQAFELDQFNGEDLNESSISEKIFEKIEKVYKEGLNTLRFKNKLEDDATMLLLYFANNKT